MTDRPTTTTDRPALRPAAPERKSVTDHQPTTDRPAPTDTPTDRNTWLGRLIRPTDPKEATMPTRPTVAPTDTTNPTDTEQPTNRLSRWRKNRTDKATDRQNKATDQAAKATALAARRPTDHQPTTTAPTDQDIAPIPAWLTWLGVWADRTFGALPLAAPLVVSGAYTMQVFTGDVIDAHPVIALLAACALEGGLWKLSRLYEKTLVAGDSTIALRAGIGVYIALIAGLIYWNADHAAKAQGRTELGDDAFPAFGVAVMCAFGVYIWSRTARWQRRRELHAAGRVDTQAPKFAALAWILTPVETPKALRHAVKYRIPSPVAAVEDRRLYVAAGKPAIWPPIDPTDQADRIDQAATLPTDRTPTVVAPTDLSAPALTAVAPTIAKPTRPTVPAQPTTATRPVATRPVAAQPATDRSPVAPAPTAAPTVRVAQPTDADRPTFTPAALRNAATIRSRYGTTTDLRLATVRGDLRWSFDRADPAFKAYLAGADQSADQPVAVGA
ncbi:hypothetical protein ACH4T9_12735 [Micromonospora sp. NPDC020750]|uniref:hypothetical protein n=1 Tax=unclassified Micromonospora TaxID=2617518 RepID=UPI0037923262